MSSAGLPTVPFQREPATIQRRGRTQLASHIGRDSDRAPRLCAQVGGESSEAPESPRGCYALGRPGRRPTLGVAHCLAVLFPARVGPGNVRRTSRCCRPSWGQVGGSELGAKPPCGAVFLSGRARGVLKSSRMLRLRGARPEATARCRSRRSAVLFPARVGPRIARKSPRCCIPW